MCLLHNAGQVAAQHKAWVARVRADGHLIWSYTQEFEASLPIVEESEFNGAAEMDDGSILLCGNSIRAPTEFAPAVLVRLDSGGRVLNQVELAPAGKASVGRFEFKPAYVGARAWPSLREPRASA